MQKTNVAKTNVAKTNVANINIAVACGSTDCACFPKFSSLKMSFAESLQYRGSCHDAIMQGQLGQYIQPHTKHMGAWFKSRW